MSDINKRPTNAPITDIIPHAPITEKIDFSKIHQGKATNELAKIQTVIDNPAQLNLYGGAIITTDKDYKLFIERYHELTNGVRPTAKMLLDALVIKLTEGGHKDTLVKLPLSEYMDMRGLKDIKSAREQVKEDIRALDRLRIEYREKLKGKQGDFLNVSISGGTNGIVRGIIVFRFNQDFFNVLIKYPIMPYPKEILSLNPKKNPNSPYLLRRISEHKNMNYFKSNADIISVKTLLKASPELPKYEDIKDMGQIEQRIITPFERDMDAISTFKWYYCGKNSVKVEQPANYFEFEQLNIKIEWTSYPTRDKPKRAYKKKKGKPEGAS